MRGQVWFVCTPGTVILAIHGQQPLLRPLASGVKWCRMFNEWHKQRSHSVLEDP